MPGRRRRRAFVAALRNRVTSNMYATSERWDAHRRKQSLTVASPWLASTRQQTVSYALWYAALSWQLIYEYLDGASTEDEPDAQVSADVERMGAVADSWTDFAVRVQSELDGSAVPQVSEQPLQAPRVTAATAPGVWRLADEIAGRVERDWTSVSASLAPRFAAVARSVEAALRPNLQLMTYLREQWLLSTDSEVFLNLAQRAIVPAGEIYLAGQRIQAPYLIGASYAEARSRRMTLEDLDLAFDPWLLTDPVHVRARRNDPASQEQLNQFWQGLANPSSGKVLAEELAQARRRRRIRYRHSHGYPNAPWPPQWLVRYPITFGTRQFQPGDLISLLVSDAQPGNRIVEVRKSGRVLRRADLLGM